MISETDRNYVIWQNRAFRFYLAVLSEDECSNYFIEISGEVLFWDHETNKQKVLSSSLNEFISICETPSEVELDPGQVESVWVDPDFAAKFGIKPMP